MHLGHAEDFPDVGNAEVPCCLGAAVYGPERCTCWRPVYDQEQAPQCAGPAPVRASMCRDCAFRPDSPERTGDERYDHSDEDGLADVVRGDFVCHQGMRRILRYEHPSGAVHQVDVDAYDPPDPRAPARADGQPASMCAGWWAARRREAAAG